MTVDDDGSGRRLISVRVAPPPPPPRSPGAEAAARYRARRRGENVPKRKPGPKPADITTLRHQIGDLEAKVAERRLQLRLLGEQVRRRRTAALVVDRAAGDLLAALARDDPRRDWPERQELLGHVLAAIESRHQHWVR